MILLVLRLYSGLRDSVVESRWNPKGVPAISRLIDQLDLRGDDCRVIFYDLSPQPSVPAGTKSLNGLTVPVRVFNMPMPFLKSDRLMKFILAIYTVCWAFRESAGLVYTDRANILGGGLCSRLGIPTVIRMLGCPPDLYDGFGRKGKLSLSRWACHSPFAAVIGTEDGSKIREFAERFLRKEVRVERRLNGIDRGLLGGVNRHEGEGDLAVVAVGRLAESKGCLEVLDSWGNYVARGGQGKLEFIGDGELREVLEERIVEQRLEDSVEVRGAIPHRQLLQELGRFDVYLSFNRDGQLSNTNLEAMASGLCLILSESNGDDDAAREIGMRDEVVFWVGSEDRGRQVSDILERLSVDSGLLQSRKEKAVKQSASFAGWQERIGWELDILADLKK